MVKKEKFIPDEFPSEEDLQRYVKWLEDNGVYYAENVKVKDIKLDKRKSLMIHDLKIPGCYLRCSGKFLYEAFSEQHPVKLLDDDFMVSLYFDGVIKPEVFMKSNVVIIKDRKAKRKKSTIGMS